MSTNVAPVPPSAPVVLLLLTRTVPSLMVTGPVFELEKPLVPLGLPRISVPGPDLVMPPLPVITFVLPRINVSVAHHVKDALGRAEGENGLARASVIDDAVAAGLQNRGGAA